MKRENAIYDLWNTGRYTTQEELAKTLGISSKHIYNILRAKGVREDLKVKGIGTQFSTQTLVEVAPLPPTHQEQILRKVEGKEISPSQVREFVKEVDIKFIN